MKRIGPKMAEVTRLAHKCPGHAVVWYAAHVGPHGSLKFGYDIVNRAHNAGLIDLIKAPHHSGTYIVVPPGGKLGHRRMVDGKLAYFVQVCGEWFPSLQVAS